MNLNAYRTAKFLVACLLTFTASSPSWAAGEVFVAPVFMTPAVEEKVAVPAGRVYVSELGNLREGSRAMVQVASENKAFPDITALVMEKAAVQAYLAGQRVAATGFEKKAPPLTVQFTSPREAEYVLVLDNRYSMLMTKQVRTKVVVAQKLTTSEMQAMQTAIATVTTRVRARYEVPAFDVKVQPCGMANAFSRFSDGAITLCTEMIAKTGKQPGALVGIVYHEVGHSLLSLWGLPGHNNEDTADEFAVQLALRTPNEAKIIDQFASFFESGDPWMEARVMIEQGDRHSLGVQRVRNIRSALKAPKELTDRWNELTYPRMTTEALTAIAQNPGQFESAALASKVLSSRQAVGSTAGAPRREPTPANVFQLAPAPPFEKYPARLTEGAMPAGPHQKVNYGGRYSIAVNSCGIGCRYYTMRDMATGQDLNWLARFASAEPRPRTKDGYEYISMLYSKPDSSLLVAQFEVSMPSGKTECWEQFFVPNGGAMKSTGPVTKSCSRVE